MKLDTDKIKEIMRASGINITELSQKFGCTHQYISILLKRQNTTLKTVDKLAKALGCDALDILELESTKIGG